MKQQELEDAVNEALFMPAELKKSLSDISCMSMELFVSKRAQAASDKECISMKSECGLNHRRLSVINGAGRKVGLLQRHSLSLVVVVVVAAAAAVRLSRNQE